ncbi:MAG: zinc ribbon domain-containing protein [Coriobacteriia bacterium]|nr:zinc ribbon domain-containing protein [Coriobacteriia bacterium]
MQCPACGAEVASDGAFCGSCGASLQAQAPPDPGAAYPPAHPAPVAPASPAAPPVQPGQYIGPQPAAAASPAPAAPPAKRGLPAVAIVAIVVGALILACAVVGGGLFAFRAFNASDEVALPAVTPPAPAPSAVATEMPDPALEEPDPTVEEPAATDAIVTEDEASAVVTQFMDTRASGDIEGSKVYCSKTMLAGEYGDFVSDKYWKPDSYKITRTTPDLMYVHVTTMGMWPSGEEPTIFSVLRDPDSGQVLIDGMLDPENVPELWK